MAHLISILIRSRNDEAYIGRTLEAVFRQRCTVPFEVLACDDASEDGTAGIIAQYPAVRCLPRPAGRYRPGRTLNYLIAQSRGNFVVFNNADAVPLNSRWLENLIGPLLAGTADAVYGRQRPRPDADYLVRRDYRRAFGAGLAKPGGRRFFFSLVTSAACKADLEECPFDEDMLFSEDVEWALRRERRIVYANDALVEHSHNYSWDALQKRFYGEGYADASIFHCRPDWFRELGGGVMEVCRDFFFLLRHPAGLKELPLSPRRRFTQKYYHWKGIRDYFREKSHA